MASPLDAAPWSSVFQPKVRIPDIDSAFIMVVRALIHLLLADEVPYGAAGTAARGCQPERARGAGAGHLPLQHPPARRRSSSRVRELLQTTTMVSEHSQHTPTLEPTESEQSCVAARSGTRIKLSTPH